MLLFYLSIYNPLQICRYSVLPALTMDGIIFLNVVNGSFDGDSFQEFLCRLLQVMNPYPAKNSVLVMDNCRIHHVDGVAELCSERYTFILLLYQPIYNSI
jgi:hypothetical protein